MLDVKQTEHNVDVVAYALYIATGGSREIESISELSSVDIEHYRKLARVAIDALRFDGK